MARLFTDNLTGETIVVHEQFNPWDDTRIWVETGRVPAGQDIQALVDLTIRGVTAEQMYRQIKETIDD